MLITDLKHKPAAGGKQEHYVFSLVFQLGRGTAKVTGWRFYPGSSLVRGPVRFAGGRTVPIGFLDSAGQDWVRQAFKDRDRIVEALRAYIDAPPERQQSVRLALGQNNDSIRGTEPGLPSGGQGPAEGD